MDHQHLKHSKTIAHAKAHHSESLSAEQSEIKDVLDDFAEAIRNGDLDEIISFYSEDLTAFDMMPPLRFEGVEKYRRIAWKECFTDAFTFPVHYEWNEMKIEVQGDLAIAYGLIHMKGKFKGGDEMEAWLRNTTCFKQVDANWLISHEHNSAPSSMDGKVLMNLPPDKSMHEFKS